MAIAEYELAKETARRRLITAPFDGSIIEFYHQLGESARSSNRPCSGSWIHGAAISCVTWMPKPGMGYALGQSVNLEIESGAAPC